MASVADLGKMVKAKYPGQYDDLGDADLGSKVKAKFSGSYDDFSDAADPTFKGNPARNIRQKNMGRPAQAPEPTTISPEDIPGMSPASMVGRGLVQAGQGAQEVGKGQYARGASDMIRGAGQYAAPFTLPTALATAPVTTAAGLAGGAIGSGVGQAAAGAMGATPDQASLAGDLSGIAGGALGAGAVQRASPYAQKLMEMMKNNPKLQGQAMDLIPGHSYGKKVINISRGLADAMGGPGIPSAPPQTPPAPLRPAPQAELNTPHPLAPTGMRPAPQGEPPPLPAPSSPPPPSPVAPRTPAWQGIQAQMPTAPADATPIPGQLPSGRIPGPAPLPPPPSAPPGAGRVPAWKQIQAQMPPTPPNATPIPGQLPSGRTPGSISNQVTQIPPDIQDSIRGSVDPESIGIHGGQEGQPIPISGHPDFAPSRFRPGQAARQQQPAPGSLSKEQTLEEILQDPNKFSAAKKLFDALQGGQ